MIPSSNEIIADFVSLEFNAFLKLSAMSLTGFYNKKNKL